MTLIDPAASDTLDSYGHEYYELRKKKGMTEEEAREGIQDPLRWGSMMVRLEDADAMVAGAENATGKVLVAAFTIIKTAPGVNYASSCFVMSLDDTQWGAGGNMIFADCATIPIRRPNSWRRSRSPVPNPARPSSMPSLSCSSLLLDQRLGLAPLRRQGYSGF